MASKSQTTGKSLVIVESPAKAKTINRYLGSSFKVMASMGHVRDLPARDLGVDLDNRFEPVYEILGDKQKIVRELRKVADKADTVYLATDLDREGEAIAWHLFAALELDAEHTQRVVFNEITKSAIQQAFATPHVLDMDKVNAQQARRVLDRIVGYQLSPLLQQKIGKGLSAGRVQSVAVRLIVAREEEIRAFQPEESWRIFACLATQPEKTGKRQEQWEKFLAGAKDPNAGPTVKQRTAWLSKHACLHAELIKVDGKDPRSANVTEATAIAEALGFVTDDVIESDLEGHADKGLKVITLKGKTDAEAAPKYSVSSIQTRRTTSKPSPPFTTASLQQAASSALGFAPSRTMRVAQQLYEGIDLGDADGPVGLITYMRTDSVNLSKDAVAAARDLIQGEFGGDYLPAKPNVFAAGKRAQEAHEAVRASDPQRQPESLRDKLSSEQFRLYDLIWRRYVACQMTPAKWDSTTILVSADTTLGEAVFRTNGRRLVFDGFLRVSRAADTSDVILPDIADKSELGLVDLEPKQQFTSPPPRYSEASLVKKLEAEGIGRPSTYAAIIHTIQDRGYVELVDKKMHPTDRGEVVTQKLVAHFPKIMDFKFTSYMEDELDKIEDAHLDWVKVLQEFYEPFKAALDLAGVEMDVVRAEPSDYRCPECDREMVYRLGRNGRFLSCTGYPECKTTRNVDREGRIVEEVVAEAPCALCGKPMILRKSRIGPFLGCTGYPECTNTLPSDEHGNELKKVKPEDIKETCDDCRSPMSVKFARGRSFLGCDAYPKCKATKQIPDGLFVEKPKPVDAGVRCDKCGRAMVIRKGRRGAFLSCVGFPRCRNAMPEDKIEHLRTLEAEGKIPDAPPEIKPGARGKKGAAGKQVKVDITALGAPPEGFAWTRTGRPVVETWPEEPLNCPECGNEVSLKDGRFGPYYGCGAYPKCRFVSNLRGDAKKRAAIEMPTPDKPKPIPTDVPCDECGEPMLIRTGRSGQFLGCSKYPKCRFSKPLPEGTTAASLASTA